MILATHGTQIRTIKTLILPTPTAKIMIYVLPWSRIASKITDIKFLNLSWYVPRNRYVHFSETWGTSYGTDKEHLFLEAHSNSSRKFRSINYWFLLNISDCTYRNCHMSTTVSWYTLVCSTEHIWRKLQENSNCWFWKQYGVPKSCAEYCKPTPWHQR